MSIYVPQYKEHATAAVPNCMCGDQGRNRNEGECKRRSSCYGCGFDRTEYMRRINLIHNAGLTELGERRKERLLKEYKANVSKPLYGLTIGKKRQQREEDQQQKELG